MLAEQTPARYVAFDLLALEDDSLLELPLAERREALERLVSGPVGLTPLTADAAEAEPWLKPLLESGNPEIAGRAATTLGLIAQRAGQDAKAVKLFETGSDKLAGDDSARALLYMGDSYRSMSLEPRAKESYTLAQSRAKNDEQLKSTIGSRLSKRPDAPSMWLPYVAVADCDATATRAKALGGKVLMEPSDIPNIGRYAIAEDPLGAAIAFIKLAG